MTKCFCIWSLLWQSFRNCTPQSSVGGFIHVDHRSFARRKCLGQRAVHPIRPSWPTVHRKRCPIWSFWEKGTAPLLLRRFSGQAGNSAQPNARSKSRDRLLVHSSRHGQMPSAVATLVILMGIASARPIDKWNRAQLSAWTHFQDSQDLSMKASGGWTASCMPKDTRCLELDSQGYLRGEPVLEAIAGSKGCNKCGQHKK